MKTKKYLEKVAYVKELDLSNGNGDPDFIMDSYFSKFDDSYIAHVGMEKNIKFLAEREITEELTHGVGFSPKDNKWYGWSHRAIYGFEIGSTCKKGDCHYVGSTEKEQEEAAIQFWDSGSNLDMPRCEGIITNDDGERYFDIKWDYGFSPKLIPNTKLHGTIGGCHHFITPLGRGEWVAKTMDDAKKMAIDFNEGVS